MNRPLPPPSAAHPPRLPALIASLALVFALLLPGCGPGRAAQSPRDGLLGPTPPPGRRVVIDGSFDDWPPNAASMADADYWYFSVRVPAAQNLQDGGEPLSLLIDADNDPSTGRLFPAPPAAQNMGVDLEITFCPPDRQRPGPGHGVVGTAYLSSGDARPFTPGQLGMTLAPTFAATRFEFRIARRPDPDATGADTPPTFGWFNPTARKASALWVLKDATGAIVGGSRGGAEYFQVPPPAAAGRYPDASIPDKPDGAFRVMSFNVLKANPVINFPPFQRVFQTLKPDVILIEEWDDTDAASLVAWFASLVGGEGEWHARTAAGRGVAIVSRHPIDALGPDSLPGLGPANPGRDPAPVRWVAGVVRAPIGDVAVGAVHLKCCGSLGSNEDRQRTGEAEVINAAFGAALSAAPTALRVIAGDVNLVGGRAPLDLLRAKLDTDGSDLAVAEPYVLGDSTNATWRDAQTAFPAGRLDYLLYSDASARVVNQFVLDTGKLSDATLAKLGLKREDAAASDHLPVIADLMPITRR